jgi:preprotein translocase subunit SecD
VGRPLTGFWLVVLGATALGLGLAACGGGDDDAEEPRVEQGTRFAFYDWEPNVVPNPDARPERATETPFPRLADALRASRRSEACDEGCIVVAAEPSSSLPGYFVLRDKPELTAADIVEPEATSFPPSDEPVMAFGFTEDGQERFRALTARVASRGDPKEGPAGADHFAVVYGEAIIARPIVNPADNPDGIDGENGAAIGGGLSVQEVEELVAFLQTNGGE